MSTAEQKQLPWWTWIVPIIILHLGSQVSVLLRYDQGVSAYYLPTAFSIIMIQWWGPARILPAVFLNAILSTSLWGVTRIYLWPVYGFTDVIAAFLSWYFFVHKAKGKCWFPDVRNLLLFLTIGIIIPVIIEIAYLEFVQIYFGDQSTDQFVNYVTINLISEFISLFGLTIPVLYYVTPFMAKHNFTIFSGKPERHDELDIKQYSEIGFLYFVLMGLTFVLHFEQYWFVYGFFSLYVAIRFGFGQAVLMNGFIFLISYILPLLLKAAPESNLTVDMRFTNIHIGSSLLYLFSAVTGRVISDLKKVEGKLTTQNRELEVTNRELDRFVYSVSHDLSAPLKSILGLVNISRLSNDQRDHFDYIGKIESSVLKLESFIKEILDYSRDKRQEIYIEQIELKGLCTEILENLRFLDGYKKIKLDITDLRPIQLNNDRSRLKIIINNLLANAIVFQKRMPENDPFIKISSSQMKDKIIVEIEDNGEGIKPDLQNRIFDMFFRGTANSRGSGMGLYVAREAATKIDGRILVRSEYGKGSTFTVELKHIASN